MRNKKKRSKPYQKSLQKTLTSLISNKPKNKSLLILLRYLILLGLMFTLPLIYKTFTPLTFYPSIFLLKLFYDVTINNLLVIINDKTFIQIIPACIAGSAYLLLLILNLSIPMKLKKRIYLIFISFFILLILNILRIFILSVLFYHNFIFFDITHKLFWYFLSTVFVVLIWLFIVKKYSIKEIPVYSDIRYLMKNIH
ncbi:MAG: pacearchaeosortase [Nanoarchaeota archaeon]